MSDEGEGVMPNPYAGRFAASSDEIKDALRAAWQDGDESAFEVALELIEEDWTWQQKQNAKIEAWKAAPKWGVV